MVGDEDEPCVDINLFLKRTMPMAGLVVTPKSGHPINLEDPAAFDARIDAVHADVGATHSAPVARRRETVETLVTGFGRFCEK